MKERSLKLAVGFLGLLSKIARCGSNKDLWMTTAVLNFVHSSGAMEYSSRLQSLGWMAGAQGEERVLARDLLRHGLEIFESFGAAVDEEASKRRKECEKKLSDIVKLLLVNRELNFVKIGRERGTKSQECAAISQRPLQPISSEALEKRKEDGDPKKEPLSDLPISLASLVDRVRLLKDDGNSRLVFYGQGGEHIGSAREMAKKSAKIFTKASEKLFTGGDDDVRNFLQEDLEGARSLLAGIKSVNKEKKREVYAVKKSVEAMMKSLRTEHGLSDRQGNLHSGVCGTAFSAAVTGASGDVAALAVLFDEMARSLRSNVKNLSPRFEERALGLARHGLLRVAEEASGEAGRFKEAEAELGRICDEVSSLEVEGSSLRKARGILKRMVKTCRAMERRDGRFRKRPLSEEGKRLLSSLRGGAQALKEALKVPADAGIEKALRKCEAAVFALCQGYPVLKQDLGEKSLEVYREGCRTRSDICSLLEVLPDKKEAEEGCGDDDPFNTFLSRSMSRCLNGMRRAEKIILAQGEDDQKQRLLDTSTAQEVMNALDPQERAAELRHLLRRTELTAGRRRLLLEAGAILDVFVGMCGSVSAWSEAVLSGSAAFLGCVMRCFAHFSTIPPVKDSEEDEKDGDEEGEDNGGGDAKPGGGVGLGEGEGEKATTEGVESEDLFENPQDEGGEEEDKEKDSEKKDEKNDDFVDFSDKLQEDRLADKSDDEDDDDGEGEKDEDQMSDMEGETNQEDEDQHKKDDLLDADDWKQDEEEKEEKESDDKEREENLQADFISNEENPQQKENQDEQQPSNDAVDKEDDKEKRERQPDADDEDADIEDQADDGRFRDQEEPEVEDLDMNDDDQFMDDAEGGASEEEADMDIQGRLLGSEKYRLFMLMLLLPFFASFL